MPRATKLGDALGLFAITAWGCLPFLSTLQFWPIAPDSISWIVRGAPSTPDWARWVFATQHFGVGYRPITALSYTLNAALSGFDPLPFRLTDVLLHAVAGVLVFALFRTLFREAPRWAAWLAVAIFVAHPSAQEVVPYIARRSYALGTIFGLGALLVFCRGRRRSTPLMVGGLFAAALLSHEAAILPIALLPWLQRSTRTSEASRGWLIAWLVALAAVLGRAVVVSGVGGYEWEGDALGRAVDIFAASLRSAAGTGSVAAWLVFGPYFVWRAFSDGRRDTSESPGARLLASWVVGYAVLYATQGVWFPRQTYLMAAPLALLLAAALAATLTARRRSGWALAAHLVPQLLLLAILLSGSAAVRGQDADRLRDWQRRDALLSNLLREVSASREPAHVRLVLPYRAPTVRGESLRAREAPLELSRRSRRTATWVRAVLFEQDVVVEDFLRVAASEDGGGLLAKVVAEPGNASVLIPADRRYYVYTDERFVRHSDSATRRVPIPSPREHADRNQYLFIGDARRGALIPVDSASPAP